VKVSTIYQLSSKIFNLSKLICLIDFEFWFFYFNISLTNFYPNFDFKKKFLINLDSILSSKKYYFQNCPETILANKILKIGNQINKL